MDSNSAFGDTLSVGRALQTNAAFSVNHPLYQALSDQIERRVGEYAAQKGLARVALRVSLVAVTLSAQEVTCLADMFPEFRFAACPAMRPAHAFFVQCRRSASEWLLAQAERSGDTVVMFGTALTAALESTLDRVLLVVDPASPVTVHERHSASMDAYRMYRDHLSVSDAVGKSLSKSRYDAYLRGERVRFQSAWGFSERGDALCVDGFLNAYSPSQVALAMLSAGAEVAYGFVPYHPVMMLDDEGELPGFGVHYRFTSSELRFEYPEGVSGVTSYPLSVWQAWMTGHTFSSWRDGAGYFQLELLKHRGCFMFYRLVMVKGKPDLDSPIVHALDVGAVGDQYVVTSFSLKSVSASLTDRENWRARHYLVSKRLVDRVYQFAMQLPREQMTRYAIRKQLHIVNDRVTIEGTSVVVSSRLGEEMVDALVVDIFARAFVDRYDSGRLTAEACKFVDDYDGFRSSNGFYKLWYVIATVVVLGWDVVIQPAVGWVRKVADAVRDFLSPSPRLAAPTFRRAPSYVLTVGVARDLVDLRGVRALVNEADRVSALSSVGFFSVALKSITRVTSEAGLALGASTFRVSPVPLFDTSPAASEQAGAVVALVRGLNEMDQAPASRRALEVCQATRVLRQDRVEHFNPVADPVYVLNEAYSSVFPGVAEQALEFDTASLSLDPQDRTLMAPYLRLPRYFGDAPRPKKYYRSDLRALGVPKRQGTLQELLSAVAARNLNAPQVALPQDDGVTALAVWENFLSVACHDEAASLLESYARDPIGLEEDAFREWVSQSSPDKVAAVKRELEEKSEALAQMPVGDYLVMLKADVKPPLSKKPLDTRTEPQVIVYHEKALSSLYSCMFRVLVRRFLALLKPNYHVNLLKDTRDMEAFVQGVHPFGVLDLRFLENDFSKYDKSQGRFVFVLEQLVFSRLGLNAEWLRQWMGGHVECSLRALSLGLSLHVMYQRKSGDATTSFGNVVLNVLSVTYAYRGTEVIWALFMGDDSLVCTRRVAGDQEAARVLAEVFNLGAKTYLTTEPYFASNFVVIDNVNRAVYFVPDPVKRIERWSMSISADDPQWTERYVSAVDAMRNYLNVAKTALLPSMVAARYDVSEAAVAGAADAIATVLSSEAKFRSMWEASPTESFY